MFDWLFGKKKADGAPAPAKAAKPAKPAKAAKPGKGGKPAKPAPPPKPKKVVKPKIAKIDIAKRFDIPNQTTGQGSMSKVYKARDKQTGRTVCLKVLDKAKTAKFEARFPKNFNKPSEGEVCAALKHKNVVNTFEFGLSAKTGEMWLSMEWIEGLGLNFLIETRSSKLNGQRIDMLMQMCDGLEYIHKQGYLHRDICPRNVMIDQEGVIKLIDFGLALPYKPEFCRPGNRTGTPDFLAPEIIRRTTTDHRVDLFALGVTAYEMFTNALPWEKKPDSLQTLFTHVNLAGKSILELVPDLHPPTAAVLMKAIEREPRDRYQSAAEFKAALSVLPPA